MIGQLNRIIQEIEHEWAGKHLLVVGDVMLDKYVWGEVGRISPEAPVPVVRGIHQDEKPGGAANVAMNLARLGAQTTVVGLTGGDENEKLLAASLRSNGVTSHFVVSEGFPTITKTRILGGRQQMLRLDFERAGTRAPQDYDRLTQAALNLLPGSDALVLSDYGKGALSPEVCQALILAARKLGIPVLVDPKGRTIRTTVALPPFAPTSMSWLVQRTSIPAIWICCLPRPKPWYRPSTLNSWLQR